MTAVAWQRRLNDVFAEAGVNIVLEQWIILVNLFYHNDVVQGSLANMLMRDKSFMTRIVDDLEGRELVQRRRDPADRRRWRIHLTDRGRRFVKPVLDIVIRTSHLAQSGLANEKLDCTREVLRHMFRNLTGYSVESCWGKVEEDQNPD
jgi:DNA-binding MarR family transcriptional regulator